MGETPFSGPPFLFNNGYATSLNVEARGVETEVFFEWNPPQR